MKSIILLVALAAGTLSLDQLDLPVGTTVKDVPDDLADQLVAEGKAQAADVAPAAPAASGKRLVKARVLVDGIYGSVNAVVTVTAAAAKASSELDADPAAVDYAESLAAGGQ